MRNRFCLRKSANKDKRIPFSWNCILFLRVCVIVITFISANGQCSSGGKMFSKDSKQNNVTTPSSAAEFDIEINSLSIKSNTESTQIIKTNGSTELDSEVHSNKAITENIINSIENALIPEPDYESPLSTSSIPDLKKKKQPSTDESPEIDTEEEEDSQISIASSTSEMEIVYDEEGEVASKLIGGNVSDEELFDAETNSLVTPISYIPQTASPKAIISTSLTPSRPSTRVVPYSSTPRSSRNKYHLLKKVSTKSMIPLNNLQITTTKRPKKVVKSRTKKFTKVQKPPRSATPAPQHNRNPHHPHGVVVFDKRKKRPKPGRTKGKTTATTTSTTTVKTTTTTTASTTPFATESDDYYEYYWNSGESSESNEISIDNSTSIKNSTTNKKRISSKIPLSKLAMAMIASSTIFNNSTGSDDALYYPKTPVNLLNILQSYTKQLQIANGESSSVAVKPVVQIQGTTPFMLQLSQLPFGTRVAISVYYSLIAIIPLVYLAFGGLGRLGFLNAFAGRGFGRRRRRRRRSYSGDYYQNGMFDRYRPTVLQRADLNEQKEDEYMWILGRISEIILEFSLLTDGDEKQ